MKLTTDLSLVSWLRMSRAIPPLPYVLSWHVQCNFTFSCMENILHHFAKTWSASLKEFFVTGEYLK